MTKLQQAVQPSARPAQGFAAAWARTDFQALCVAEAHNAGVLGHSTALALAAPEAHGHSEFAPDAWPSFQKLVSSEFRMGWIPEQASAAWVHHQRADRRVIADLWDPHVSRLLADAINSPHVRGGVVLTLEGPSVLAFADLILSPARLASSRTILAKRLRWLADAKRLCLMTSTELSNSTEKGLVQAGVTVEGHAFEWLGAMPPEEPCFEPNILLAPELRSLQDETAIVQVLREIVGILSLEGPMRYVPAGWEPGSLLEEWQRSGVVNVSRGTVWIGQHLRALRQNQTVNVVNDRNLAVWKAVTKAAGASWVNHPLSSAARS
ncbi:hypothetical protein ACXA45_10100 [Neomicrococcus lactis]